MTTANTIPVTNLCAHYQTDASFFDTLQEFGLVEIVVIEQTPCILTEKIREVERMIHLHYDLNINMEGLDAIVHLLSRIEQLNQQLLVANSKLRTIDGL